MALFIGFVSHSVGLESSFEVFFKLLCPLPGLVDGGTNAEDVLGVTRAQVSQCFGLGWLKCIGMGDPASCIWSISHMLRRGGLYVFLSLEGKWFDGDCSPGDQADALTLRS